MVPYCNYIKQSSMYVCINCMHWRNKYNIYELICLFVYLVDVCPFFDESIHFVRIASLRRINKSNLPKWKVSTYVCKKKSSHVILWKHFYGHPSPITILSVHFCSKLATSSCPGPRGVSDGGPLAISRAVSPCRWFASDTRIWLIIET